MTCPICARTSHKNYRPFCSRRCADVDLGRWLTGGYAIPIVEDDEDETRDEGRPEDTPRDA